MHLVRPGLGDDQNLRAGTLAVLRTIGIAKQVEFPHGVDAQQLLAGAAGLHVVLRRAGEFHAVQQEQILLRPISLETAKLFPAVEFDTPMPPVFSQVKLTTRDSE
jgi:hypothetical protein